MRVLGFSKRWQKLSNPEFTTFRFTRRDRDWQVGELVQVIYKPRTKNRLPLGQAEIVNKEECWIFSANKPRGAKMLTPKEARADGFMGYGDMALWLSKAHGHQHLVDEPMNKLTLRWLRRVVETVSSS